MERPIAGQVVVIPLGEGDADLGRARLVDGSQPGSVERGVGEAAVAHVVLNRKKSGRWGHEIKKIVTQPWQFEPWMTRRREIENLSPDDPRYRKAARIADAVLDGDIPDPTSGATQFLNETIVRQRRGGSLPRWAQAEGLVIGRHTFYSPDEANAGMGQASLALMFMQQASLSC